MLVRKMRPHSLEKKVTQHDFKMKLFKQRVSDKVIRNNFPDMVPFLDDHGNSSSGGSGMVA